MAIQQNKTKTLRRTAGVKASQKPALKKLEGLADLFINFEVEAEKLVRRFIEKADHSSRNLKKTVASLVKQVKSAGLATVAHEKKEELVHRIEEVLGKAREIQFLPDTLSRDEIIREAKKNLEDLMARIQSSPVLEKARKKACDTKNHVFSLLSIPSQNQVFQLSRKIASLESRVSQLTRKAA